MQIVIALLLLLAAHYGLTPFAPAGAGRAGLLWPFAADSQPVLAAVGGLPRPGGSAFVPLLAGLAGLGCIGAALGLLGFAVPVLWWRPLTILATSASIVLFAAFFGRWAVLPLALDAFLLWLALAGPGVVFGLP